MGTNAGGCLFTGTGAVNTSNLWSATSHGTCAGDAWVNGTCTSFVCNYSTYNLAGDGYHLTSTSPSRNAGETTYCNTYTSLLDIDGDARTGNCDAGPDEYIAVEANIWIEAGAGTCTGGRSATPIEYSASASPDRRCGSIDQAWDAMNAGDTARMVEGTYTDQIVSGNKASQTFVIGNGDGDDVIIGDGGDAISCTATGWSALCAEAAFMTLENVTTVASDPGPAGGLKVVGANVTVRNFTTIGATGSGATLHCIFTGLSETSDTCGTSVEVTAANFTFDGGRIGSVSYEEDLTCPHPSVQPLLLSSGGDSATFIGVQFGRYHPIAFPPNTGTCGDEGNGTGIPHLETIRFENVSNTLIRDSVFNGPGDHGSGHMFSSATTSNVTFINNVFEERGNANAMLQCNGCTMTNWNWYYNTFLDDGGFANVSGMDFAGNFGYTPGCGATNVKNVYAGSGSCGTNTYIGGTSFGVDSDGKLQVGSPAIDAAETPGVSDTCTDAATVNSLDREGTVRPQGTICDAGADER